MIPPLLPENMNIGWLHQVNLVLGLVCGWWIAGPRIGRGYPEGISAGLTGMAALVFWGLFIQSFNEMLGRALERRYAGPVEGITAVFELGAEFGLLLLNGPLIGFLIGSSIAVGLIAEWASHRWS